MCVCFLHSSVGGLAYVTVFKSPPLVQPHSVFGGTSACWFVARFHNPSNSDKDYRIFNVRTWSFVCVRWAHRQRVTTTFLTRKNSVFLVLLTGFEPSTFGSPVQRSNHWANTSSQLFIYVLDFVLKDQLFLSQIIKQWEVVALEQLTSHIEHIEQAHNIDPSRIR